MKDEHIFANNTFLIICGAPKSGTTSLYEYFGFHPAVVKSKTKETRFFLQDNVSLARKYSFSEGLENYELCYPLTNTVRNKVFLEATPDYLFGASLDEICFTLPNAQLVVILRHPIEKFVSWYNYAKLRGFISPDTSSDEYLEMQIYDEANIDSAKPYECALEQGFYSKYISSLEDSTKKKLILVSFDCFKTNPVVVINEICASLEIDASCYEDYHFDILNSSQQAGVVTNNSYIRFRRWMFEKVGAYDEVLRYMRVVNRCIKKASSFVCPPAGPTDSFVTRTTLDTLGRLYKDEIEVYERLKGVKSAFGVF